MTLPPDLKPLIAEFRALVRGARRGVAFTGAGISTESGIPDFRSPGGLWSKNMPILFQDFVASAEMRAESWRRKFVLDDATKHAKPNIAHEMLARLAVEGNLAAIVTQNIDGLHIAAGTPPDRMVELHGNGTYAKCLSCGERYELDWVRVRFEASGESPDCEMCGGHVKHATISFGQAMPADDMRSRRASECRSRCLSCSRFLARRFPGGEFAFDCKAVRGEAHHRQSRADGDGRACGPRDSHEPRCGF